MEERKASAHIMTCVKSIEFKVSTVRSIKHSESQKRNQWSMRGKTLNFEAIGKPFGSLCKNETCTE
jgi:hypothetical protein